MAGVRFAFGREGPAPGVESREQAESITSCSAMVLVVAVVSLDLV